MTTSPKYRSHNRHKGKASIPGAYYHIIICTQQRQKILVDNRVASIIFDTFDWLETENRFEWICIMVMPDHVHTVIKLEEGQTLSKVLHSLKLFTARQINRHLSRNGSPLAERLHRLGNSEGSNIKQNYSLLLHEPCKKGYGNITARLSILAM